MSKFNEYLFSDLYEMSSGISTKPEQAGHGYRFVSFRTVFNNHYLPEDLPDLMNTSEEERDLYSVKEGDIFLTRTSETIDELGMSCVAVRDYPNTTFSGFLKRLRPKIPNVAYHKYLAFYLRSEYFRKTMSNNAIMTLRASLNEQIFSYLKLILPSYSTQVKIGDLLFSLSEKTELNNRINAELEALAKTLYDYWFMQFDFPDANGKPYKSSGGKMVYNETLRREIPEGWEVDTLECIAGIVGGSTPSKEVEEYFSQQDGIPWITPKDLSENSGNKFITRGEFNVTEQGKRSASLKLLPKGTILMSSIAPVGYLAIASNEMTTNQGFKSFVPKEGYSTPFVYYAIKNLLPTIINNASGSTFKEVSASTLKSLNVLLPHPYIIEQYTEKVDAIFKKQENIEKENLELANLRDWLLPLLMNGQVSVSEAYERAETTLSAAAESEAAYRNG